MGKYQDSNRAMPFVHQTYGFIHQPELIAWGEACLRGNFASVFVSHTGWMYWYFENRFDAIWFKLTWHDGWFEGVL